MLCGTHFPSLKYVLRVSLKLFEYFTNSFFWCSRALEGRETRWDRGTTQRMSSEPAVLLTLRFWYWYFLMTLLTVSRSSFMALAMSLWTKGIRWRHMRLNIVWMSECFTCLSASQLLDRQLLLKAGLEIIKQTASKCKFTLQNAYQLISFRKHQNNPLMFDPLLKH